MAIIHIDLQYLPHGKGLPIPAYASPDSAGLDIPAAVTEPVTLAPGERRLIPTGFCMALPPRCEGQIRPRSGLALKHGVTVLNSPGTIDADYRGEIGVLLINHGAEAFVIERGMRIAQMVIRECVRAGFARVEALPGSVRDDQGFGSTGYGHEDQ